MKIISHIEDSDVIFRILNHLGLLEEEPVNSPERAPPVCANRGQDTEVPSVAREAYPVPGSRPSDADYYEQAPPLVSQSPTAETGELTCEPFFDDISPGEEDSLAAVLNVGKGG